MLRPERMREAALMVRTSDARRVIDALAEEKALHLIDHRQVRVGDHDVGIGTPATDTDAIAQALLKCRAMLAKLPVEGTPTPDATAPRDIIAGVSDLAERFATTEKVQDDAARRIEDLIERRKLLDLLPPDTPLRAIGRTRSVRTELLSLPRRHAAQDPIAATSPVARTDNSARSTALVTWRAKDTDAALRALEHAGIERIDLSRLTDEDGSAKDAIGRVEQAILEEKAKKAAADAAMTRFANDRAWLSRSSVALQLSLLRSQAPLHFGTTKRVTLIRGYLPASREEEMKRAIAALRVPVAFDTCDTAMAPTLLDNPAPARPFEVLISLYSLPRYREIDPTSLMAITFPLFFGFMLGDIGYGLLLLIAALVVRTKVPKMRDLATIVAISAVSATVFGILFGEVFGLEAIGGVHLPSLLHRGEDPIALIGIAAFIGICHVTLGLLLGIVNESKHGIVFGLLEKGGWLCLGAGAILILAAQGMLHTVPVLRGVAGSNALGGVLAGIGVLLILWHERMRGLLELPMLFSHVLSYLRLAAIGLSSVALALVVNDLGGGLVTRGGAWMALGVLVILLGHTINLLLGLLGPFLHSLRLHYAEFFMKFYEGGGIRYRPFGTVEETA